MTTGRLRRVYKALNEAADSGLLVAFLCLGYAFYSIGKGEHAHTIMLIALAWLLMNNRKSR